MTQLTLSLAAESDLSRFQIRPMGKQLCYGDVSRHLRQLRKAGRLSEAAELADVAAAVFNEPGWRKTYGRQQ